VVGRLELDHLDVELRCQGDENAELLEKRLRLHVAVQVEQAWAPPHARGPDAPGVDGVALPVLVEVAPGEARLQRLVGGFEDDVLADETGHPPATTAADRGRPHRCGEERLDREALVGGEIAERIGLGMAEAMDDARKESGDVVGVERREQGHRGDSPRCGSASGSWTSSKGPRRAAGPPSRAEVGIPRCSMPVARREGNAVRLGFRIGGTPGLPRGRSARGTARGRGRPRGPGACTFGPMRQPHPKSPPKGLSR
jgi:hypothetical protein